MNRKSITAFLANGGVRTLSFHEGDNGTLEFPSPELVTKIVVSDEPQQPLAAMLVKRADEPVT